MAVCRKRSTIRAPDSLSNSYLTGSPPCGISITTLMSKGGSLPIAILSMFIAASASSSVRMLAVNGAAGGGKKEKKGTGKGPGPQEHSSEKSGGLKARRGCDQSFLGGGAAFWVVAAGGAG